MVWPGQSSIQTMCDEATGSPVPAGQCQAPSCPPSSHTGRATAPLQDTFCPAARDSDQRQRTHHGQPPRNHARGRPGTSHPRAQRVGSNVSLSPSAMLEAVLTTTNQPEHSGGFGVRSKKGVTDTGMTEEQGAEEGDISTGSGPRCPLHLGGGGSMCGPPPLCQTRGTSSRRRVPPGWGQAFESWVEGGPEFRRAHTRPARANARPWTPMSIRRPHLGTHEAPEARASPGGRS